MQKKKRLSARILSMALMVAMICTMLPATVLAADIIPMSAKTIIVGGDNASNSAGLSGPYPATIEGLIYAFFEAADGDTIQLGANISDSTGSPALFNPSTLSTLTFDLNGKTISSTGSISGGTGIIGVAANQANATLNITDSAGGGKLIVNDYDAISASGYSDSGGNRYTATLNISGGTISSTNGIAICNDASGGGTANVNISGGTISAPIAYLKYDDSGTYTTSLKITGGSIKGDLADSDGGALPIPKNGSNADIYLTTITLSGVTEETAVTAITGASGYSANGLSTDSSGKVYLWVPENTVTTAVTAGGTVYSGSVTTASDNAAAATFTSGPSITVGTQPTSPAVMTYGTVNGSLTVTGTASNSNTVSYQWYKNTTNSTTGGTAVTGATNASFAIPTALDAGTHYYYCVLKAAGCADKLSNVATVTVNKATATDTMKTVAATVSQNGATGETITLSKPAEASYGSPTAGGTITMTDMSITGDTLTYTAPASTVGQTGTITIPVTSAKNYNNYNIVVTVTSTNKTPITVTGVSVANKTYNGTPAAKSGNPVYTLVGGAAVNDYTGTWDYLYTSADAGSYSAATAPTNAGAYKLTVTANDTKYSGIQEILFTISKATITITADNKSAYVGDAKPALTYTATGLASGDTLATVPTLAYESEPDMSKAGTVKIKASGAAVPNTDNYESAITYADGTLTISNKSSGGDGGGGGSSSSGNTGSSVTVDGKTESIGKVETSGSTTTVVVDSAKLDSKVSAAKDGSSVVVPVSTTKDSAAARLVMESVEKMATKDMTLEVKSGKTTYALPAAAIDTGSVLAQLGATDASKVPFTITITNEKNVKVEGATVVGTPMSFTVTATYNGKSVTVDSFDSMVARTMEITKEQAGKVTTAVVVDADGTVRHVPTSVYEQGGKWYAKINSMTNSTYALIANESKFTDVSGKWYEAAASELSAREVTDGVFGTVFEGEKNITRAEFAGLLVNAFGLPKDGKADFSDVAADAWYSEAVATANEYGIANGIGGGKFAPDATITRQEAMVMIQRAASVVSYTGGGTDNGTFTDRAEVGAWAAEGVVFNLANGLIVGSDGKISPKATITRAETATVLLRLLQKAELIDVRAEV